MTTMISSTIWGPLGIDFGKFQGGFGRRADGVRTSINLLRLACFILLVHGAALYLDLWLWRALAVEGAKYAWGAVREKDGLEADDLRG